jgi:hypothetical protein
MALELLLSQMLMLAPNGIAEVALEGAHRRG